MRRLLAQRPAPLTLALLTFTACAFLTHIAAGRWLGATAYGRAGLTLSVLVWFELACTHGLPYVAPQFVSRAPGQALALWRRFGRWGAALALAVTGLVVALAPLLARAAGYDGLAPLLQLAATDILPFTLLQLRLMLFNGLGRFGAQGALYATYGVARLGFSAGAAAAGFGEAGFVLANAAASLAALALALAVPLQRDEASGATPEAAPPPLPTLREAATLAAPMAVLHLAAHAFLNVDLWSLARLQPPGDAAVGHYVAVQTLARGPYFVSLSYALAAYGTASRALAGGDRAAAAAAVRGALARVSRLVLPAAGVLAGGAGFVLRALFGAGFVAGAPIVGPLALALAAFAHAQAFSYALSAERAQRVAALAMAVAALAAAPVCAAGYAAAGAPGVAWGLCGVATALAVALGAIVTRRFGAVVPWAHTAGAAAVGALAYVALRGGG